MDQEALCVSMTTDIWLLANRYGVSDCAVEAGKPHPLYLPSSLKRNHVSVDLTEPQHDDDITLSY